MDTCRELPRTHRSDRHAPKPQPLAGEESRASIQPLTLLLEGITAGDYLTWVRDPEPLALGRELRELAIHECQLGNRIAITLHWNGQPPEPRIAAAAAGFALTPEVRAVLTDTSGAPATAATGDLTSDGAAVNTGPGGDRCVRRINHLGRRNDR